VGDAVTQGVEVVEAGVDVAESSRV
jgi:hypothetical protein